MNLTTVVLVIALLVGVGLYIGVSSLAQQYGVDTSGSNAGLVACTPDKPINSVSAPVKFSASLPEGTPYYWSTPDGSSQFAVGGPVTVRYARAGQKTVHLFFQNTKSWQHVTCSTVIR